MRALLFFIKAKNKKKTKQKKLEAHYKTKITQNKLPLAIFINIEKKIEL